jgi:nicotinamidase-related amidase
LTGNRPCNACLKIADVDYLSPDFGAAALVTIDTQVDTLDGEALEIPGTSAAVPQIAALARAFRDAGRPIVHIVRLYERDGSNVDLCRRATVEAGMPILAPGSRGSQLAPEILAQPGLHTLEPESLLRGVPQEVGPDEVVMYKPRWGAFYETGLEDHLRRNGVSTIVFCGCNFPNCPRTSIYEASERDFRIVLAEDAISGLYDRGREELGNIGVELMPAAEIVRSLAPDRSGALDAPAFG